MNKRENTFSKGRITIHILSRFIAAFAIYVTAIMIFLFFGVTICTVYRWRGDEWIYPLLLLVNSKLPEVLITVFLIGFIGIFIFYWRKTLNYLQTIIAATENVYNENNSLITLPSELKEVEIQLNQIKLKVNESKRTAKEAEQRKNDLVVYLAHDLKTPLTSVIGYLTLLHDETQISDELKQKYLSISLDKAERLEDLINEFFEITRFNLSNITLEFSKTNLTRMLEQLIFEFEPMLNEKGLQCILNAQPNIIVNCDIDKMQRVFDNLLRNAVNYSFEQSTITINALQSSDCITVSFVNKGNTIPNEKLDRIFEQFYRLDSARTTKSGGAGLGLAIAKQIVELHGGKITAHSEKEMVTFEITVRNS